MKFKLYFCLYFYLNIELSWGFPLEYLGTRLKPMMTLFSWPQIPFRVSHHLTRHLGQGLIKLLRNSQLFPFLFEYIPIPNGLKQSGSKSCFNRRRNVESSWAPCPSMSQMTFVIIHKGMLCSRLKSFIFISMKPLISMKLGLISLIRSAWQERMTGRLVLQAKLFETFGFTKQTQDRK